MTCELNLVGALRHGAGWVQVCNGTKDETMVHFVDQYRLPSFRRTPHFRKKLSHHTFQLHCGLRATHTGLSSFVNAVIRSHLFAVEPRQGGQQLTTPYHVISPVLRIRGAPAGACQFLLFGDRHGAEKPSVDDVRSLQPHVHARIKVVDRARDFVLGEKHPAHS